MVGVVAVAAISITAIIILSNADQVGKDIGTLATGAMGVVGTIVGAYFGMRLGAETGAEGMKAAQAVALHAQSQAAEANAVATVMAAYLPEGNAPAANKAASEKGREAREAVL